ncbi:MAG: hypothetical protein M1546_03175 [Chloroflexi bacterium]|nr:hypothetical protein [Chloroflexota bacterium]
MTGIVAACSANDPSSVSSSATTPRIGVTIVVTQNADPTPADGSSVGSNQVATSQIGESEATAQPTPVPSLPSECPVPVQNPPVPVQPAAITDTAPALAAYLSAGADVNALAGVLKSWGFIYNPSNSNNPLGAVVQAKLLPGTDQQWVAVYYDPSDKDMVTRHGDVVVFKCVGGAVQIAYQSSTDPAFEGEVLNPRLFTDEDVTGDGLGDLSFLVGDCGASTCFDRISIMTAVGGPLSNVIPDFEWVAFPTFDFVPSSNGNAQNLLVAEGYLGSVGAGPQRAVTDTWSYNGAVFTLTSRIKEPPVYRIHALQDGDEAFLDQDYASANALYRRVANDPGLQAWEGNTPLRDEAQVLAAFAYVRLMQTAAAAGDSASLQAAHDALVTAAPEKSPGELFQQLGEVFYSTYQQSGNYKQACDATTKFAERNQNTFTVLGVETFGYANYDYQAVDMCIVP